MNEDAIILQGQVYELRSENAHLRQALADANTSLQAWDRWRQEQDLKAVETAAARAENFRLGIIVGVGVTTIVTILYLLLYGRLP